MAVRYIPGQGFQSVPDNQPVPFMPEVFTPKNNNNNSGGGSSGKTSTVSAEELEKSIKAAEEREAQKREAEKIEAEKIEAERIRIEKLKRDLMLAGAKESIVDTKKYTRTTISGIGQKVTIYEDKITGSVFIRTFKQGRLSGGLNSNRQTPKQVQEIKSELTSAGLTPLVRNGQVVGFSSKDTQQTYAYTDKGLEAYNRQVEMLNKKQVRLSELTPKINYGSLYRNIDAKLKGILPGGVSKKEIERATKTAQELLEEDLPGGVTYSKVRGGDGKGYTIKYVKKKDGVDVSIAKFAEAGDTAIGKVVGEIQPVTKQKGLYGLQQSINQARGSLRQRGVQNQYGLGGAKLIGYALLGGIVDTAVGIVDLPKTLKYLAQNPSEIKNIPSQIAKSGEQFGYILTTSPGEGIAYVGGSYLGLKGTNAALKGVSKVTEGTIARLNPKFVGSAKPGQVFNLKLGGGRTARVQVTSKMPKAKLNQQIALQGKRVNAISSQADELVGALRRSKVVRKPISGGTKFNAQTERLLKKFDAGRATTKDIYDLDLLLRSQGTKGLLERSFFADPSGKIRPSRLGVVKPGKTKLLDYLSEDITFKKPKPQILLFDDVQVSTFPKKLQPIAKKLRTGRTLTKVEANALLEWQLKKSGKFKPLGFVSQEAEITLAPGELIKRIKTVGVTTINGKRVPIVRAKIYKPTGQVKTLLSKYQRGTLTATERTRLNRLLKQQTGFNYGVSSSTASRGRYISIKRIGLSSSGKIIRSSRKAVSGISRRTSVRKSSSKPVSRKGSSRVSRSSRGKSSGRTSRGSSGKSGGTSRGGSSGTSRGGSSRGGSSRGGSRVPPRKPVPVVRIPKGYKTKKLSKPVQTYYVVEKVRGKFKKLYPKPLSAKYARDLAVYQIDNRLSKTAFFVPMGKSRSVVKPPKDVEGYASANARKVRPYRIRYGKKNQLVNGYIEKRKYFQDTQGERRSAARLRVSKKRVVRRPVTKRKTTTKRTQTKLTPQQRRILLQRLAKARAVRIKKLRKK